MNCEPLVFVGLVVNSALYVLLVFIAATVHGVRVSADLAIATAGFTYLAYFAQLARARDAVNLALVTASIVLGLMAGLALLVAGG